MPMNPSTTMPTTPPAGSRLLAPWARALAALLAVMMLALLAGGCATVRISEAPSRQAQDPAMAQAAALAAGHAALEGQARADNARAIQRLLAGLDDATLARGAAALPPGDPLYDFAGRALLSRGLPLPRPFDAGGTWQFDATARAPAEADGYQPPRKLAFLLPLSGNLARAAAPVRDGFLAGYYGETRTRPDISFYDTAAAGPVAAYQRAVAEGNDFVVGPLGRDEVASVFSSGALGVPMLALNRGRDTPPQGHASFSLSPEDEGIAAAEYLLQRNARRVLVIIGPDDSMRRAATAFGQRLVERGGAVTDTLYAGEDATALAPQLQAAARVEGGVDAVFLAVRGSRAHGLAPQLSLAGLAGTPRVATSQLTVGTGDAAEDRVLDGIVFPTETWSVRGLPGLPSAASLGARLPTAEGQAARLFAFGYDAWLITAYPGVAAGNREGGLRGATGMLAIDGFGNVLRTPTWSTFSGGVPVPLRDGLGG